MKAKKRAPRRKTRCIYLIQHSTMELELKAFDDKESALKQLPPLCKATGCEIITFREDLKRRRRK